MPPQAVQAGVCLEPKHHGGLPGTGRSFAAIHVAITDGSQSVTATACYESADLGALGTNPTLRTEQEQDGPCVSAWVDSVWLVLLMWGFLVGLCPPPYSRRQRTDKTSRQDASCGLDKSSEQCDPAKELLLRYPR